MFRRALLLVTAVALLASAQTAAAAEAAAAAPPGVGVSTFLQLAAALGLVLAAVFAVAWFARRIGAVPGTQGAVRVVGGTAVGSRERVVVLEIADQWVVVGVAPGRVTALATLPKGESVAVAAAGAGTTANTFQDWLRRRIEDRNAAR